MKNIAIGLLKLAKSSGDQTLLSSVVIPSITSPHNDWDTPTGYSSDCVWNHTDRGIGLTPEQIQTIK